MSGAKSKKMVRKGAPAPKTPDVGTPGTKGFK